LIISKKKYKKWQIFVEYNWIKENEKDFKPMYVEYLRNYRFNPSEVDIYLDENKELQVKISGPLHKTVLWEVPLMAIISEIYFKHHEVYETEGPLSFKDYRNLLLDKIEILHSGKCIYADFGTRRRFSFDIHDLVIDVLSKGNSFVGTSNLDLAKKYGLKAIGTQAHEWYMLTSAKESLRYANREAMKKWYETYNGRLGIALTDTYGVDNFLEHFDGFYARLYDGVRHDSGDPYTFADKVIEHYKKLNIDPTTKTIVFSDGLDPKKAVSINNYCSNKIRCSFGIGTNLTNDTGRTKALNMVIKLRSVDGIDVVKLSDNPTKATGEENALAIAMNIFFGKKVV